MPCLVSGPFAEEMFEVVGCYFPIDFTPVSSRHVFCPLSFWFARAQHIEAWIKWPPFFQMTILNAFSWTTILLKFVPRAPTDNKLIWIPFTVNLIYENLIPYISIISLILYFIYSLQMTHIESSVRTWCWVCAIAWHPAPSLQSSVSRCCWRSWRPVYRVPGLTPCSHWYGRDSWRISKQTAYFLFME